MKKPDKLYLQSLNKLLQNEIKPFNDHEKQLISKAFNRVWEYSQLNPSYEKFNHYLEIAHIVVKEIGLGVNSAISALLHGISSDEYSYDKIEKTFGHDVRTIVEGFNKISDLQTQRVSFQSETFRTMFLSIVDDIRVILVKMAHRLYDLRHPAESTPERYKKVINEVKHIYIPIAHRLGLYNIKTEMEEYLMLYESPDIYNDIKNKLKETKTKREVYIQDFLKPVERELIKAGINYQLKYRTKSIPSIWAKINRQNVDLEEVFDLFAIRIIVETKPKKEQEVCWRTYSIVTDIYPPNPKRLRDWISQPKTSGYESLHTTVKGHNDRWVEVQIRTRRMDDEAERGRAAHWIYKENHQAKDADNWLTQLRGALEKSKTSDRTVYKVDASKASKVFVFTPKGDLKQFPAGATVLDFAYDIHSDVGAHCKGAQVNNIAVPIRYVLQNGDRISIMTSNRQKPKIDWLAYVVTDRARNRIKRQLKEEKYQEAEAGKALLLRKFKNWKIKSSDDLINFLVKHFKIDTAVDLYYLVATEKLDIAFIKKVIFEKLNEESKKISDKNDREPSIQPENVAKKDREDEKEILWIGENLKNINYYFAKCCNPILGDRVFGFVTTQGKISIHRYDCPNAKRLLERYPYRVLPIKWLDTNEEIYKNAVIRIQGKDELGLVGEITSLISKDLNTNMRSINFESKGKLFDGRVTVMIKSVDHLNALIYRLGNIKGVEKVTRVK
ncbi:MAG: RelA/SpoT family protein [Bacteroidetes bacterium]|nr:MAG: RelA/SpoT family protein [Bacteroidota bacterium]